jgi:hypothetical protein
MHRERLFHAGEAAFDWRGLAGACNVPDHIAHALYVRAMQRMADVRQAEALFRRWLSAEAVKPPPHEPPVAPGRQTGLHELEDLRWLRPLPEIGSESPGRVTRVMLETARAHRHLPAAGRTHPATQAGLIGLAVPGRRTLVDQAEWAGAGLDDDRRLGLPVSQPGEPHEPEDAVAERLLGRGLPGARLPGEVAARLSAHVDSAAADAARLHTDDAADLVAAAHHAHAVTLGANI